MEENNQVLNVKGLVQYLNNEVSPNTVYRMVNDGQIPHQRLRGRIVFYRPAIDVWLAGGVEAEEKGVKE